MEREWIEKKTSTIITTTSKLFNVIVHAQALMSLPFTNSSMHNLIQEIWLEPPSRVRARTKTSHWQLADVQKKRTYSLHPCLPFVQLRIECVRFVFLTSSYNWVRPTKCMKVTIEPALSSPRMLSTTTSITLAKPEFQVFSRQRFMRYGCSGTPLPSSQ